MKPEISTPSSSASGDVAQSRDTATLHHRLTKYYAKRNAAAAPLEDARVPTDEQRLDWLIDNGHTVGGGSGFRFSVWLPHDCEDLRAAIDAAIADARGR